MVGVFTAFLAGYAGEKALDWGSGKVWLIIKKHFPPKSAQEKLYTELESYIRKVTGCDDMDVIAPVCELIYKSIDEAHHLPVSKPAYDELSKILTSHTFTIASLDLLNEDIDAILTSDTSIFRKYQLNLSRKMLSVPEPTEEDYGPIEDSATEPVPPAESLYLKLKDRLEYEQETHPSFILMNEAAGLDKDLFPKGSLQLRSGERQAELDEDDGSNNGKTPKTAALSEYIRESWLPGRPRHITIEGEGGIGKTVALLSLATEPGIFPEQVPAVYIPLHRLNLVRIEEKSNRDASSLLDAYIKSYLENELDCGCTESEVDTFYSLCCHDKDGRSQVILLLDGYNEVLDSLKRQVRQAINEWASKPGVQIITTSRTAWSCGDDFMKIRLRPLTEDDIRGYLERTGTNIPAPGDNLLRVINYPLMLTLYAHIEAVQKRVMSGLSPEILNKEDLVWHPMNRAGDIIWNYLQKELARCAENIGDRNGLSIEDHAVAILHTAPYIAWRMSREGWFSIPKEEDDRKTEEQAASFLGLVRESFAHLKDEDNWPAQLKQIINRRKRRKWIGLAKDPDSDESFNKEERIADLLLNDINLLRQKDAKLPAEGMRHKYVPEIGIMHQQFRDGLAAIWLCQRIETMEIPDSLENGIFRSTGDKYALPLCWREKIGRYVLKFAAEIMDKDAADKFWEAGRVYQPSDVKFAYTMLNLMSERSVKDGVYWNDFSDLNFSGMDLSDISLFYFRADNSNKLNLPCISKPCRTFKTKVSANTFMSSGHRGYIFSIAVTADGKRAVSGGEDEILRIWDLDQMRCVKGLPGHKGQINSVAVAADGKRAVSGSYDGTLRIWDLDQMCCEKELSGHSDSIYSVAVTADGKRAVSGGYDGILRIWDLDQMCCVKELPGHSDSIYSVAVTADGKRAVSGGKDGILRIWDLDQMCCVKELSGHSDWIRSVTVTADGKRAVSGGKDGILRIWDLDQMCCEKELPDYNNGINSVAVTADGKRAVSGGNNGILRIWDLEQRRCIKLLFAKSIWVNSIAMTADGKRAVSDSDDGGLRIWDLELMCFEKELPGHSGCINSVAMNVDGKRAVSGGDDGILCIWDLEQMRLVKGLLRHRGSINSVAVAADRKRAISGGDDRALRIWNLDEMCFEKELPGHNYWINSVAMTADGKRAVSDDGRGYNYIWDLVNMRRQDYLPDHSPFSISSVAMTADGKRAVRGGVDGILRIWDLVNKRCIKELPGHKGQIRSVTVTADGKRAVSGGYDGILRIWDLDQMCCEKELPGHSDSIYSVAVTADGKRAVSGGKDGILRIWDLVNKRCVKGLPGHKGDVLSVAMTADAKWAASGSYDGTLRIWDLECMRLKKTLQPLFGIDIIGIDLSNAIISSEEDKEILRQNGAIVC